MEVKLSSELYGVRGKNKKAIMACTQSTIVHMIAGGYVIRYKVTRSYIWKEICDLTAAVRTGKIRSLQDTF